MTAPFLVPLGARAWGEKKGFSLAWFLVSALLFLFGFVLSISRGAIFASGISICIGVVWIFTSRGRSTSARIPHFLQAGLILLLVAGITGLFIVFSGGLAGVENNTPGLPMGPARLDLAFSGIQLLQDYPFTGAGLNAFPALYSTYVLETPNFFVSHSYNLFVDIALEQGVIGLVAFGVIFVSGLCSFAGQLWDGARKWLVWAGLIGLLSVFFHGLSDDVIYNGWAVPFLFLMPGSALLITRQDPGNVPVQILPHNSDPEQVPSHSKPKIIYSGLLVAGIVLVVLLWFGRNALLASWYAELGAIQMDKIRLVDYASQQWDLGQNRQKYSTAENLFLLALQENPQNRTANFRLGFIAMRTRDFSKAIPYLETAYRADPSYRGIWKALGFCYVWTGQYSRAFSMLAKIPEAKSELDIYPWWWRAQGQEIFGERAESMQKYLLSNGLSPGWHAVLP